MLVIDYNLNTNPLAPILLCDERGRLAGLSFSFQRQFSGFDVSSVALGKEANRYQCLPGS